MQKSVANIAQSTVWNSSSSMILVLSNVKLLNSSDSHDKKKKSHCLFSKYSISFTAGSKEKTLDLDMENLGLDTTNRKSLYEKHMIKVSQNLNCSKKKIH